MTDRRPIRSLRSLGRLFGAAVLALALGACSRVEIMYAVADDVVESRASTFLDMSEADDAAHLEATVDALFETRSIVLAPKAAQFLNAQADVLEAADPAPSRAQTRAMVAELRALLRDAAEQAAPYIAEVLARHTTPERVAHLEAALAEHRAEKHEDYAGRSPQEVREERIERMTGAAERFVPDLSEDQVARIAAVVDTGIASGGRERWLLNMERKHAALVAFLRGRPGEAAIADFMVAWLSRSWTVADPGFEAQSEAWWLSRADLVFEICALMTPDQKAETVERLRDYARDIAGLTS